MAVKDRKDAYNLDLYDEQEFYKQIQRDRAKTDAKEAGSKLLEHFVVTNKNHYLKIQTMNPSAMWPATKEFYEKNAANSPMSLGNPFVHLAFASAMLTALVAYPLNGFKGLSLGKGRGSLYVEKSSTLSVVLKAIILSPFLLLQGILNTLAKPVETIRLASLAIANQWEQWKSARSEKVTQSDKESDLDSSFSSAQSMNSDDDTSLERGSYSSIASMINSAEQQHGGSRRGADALDVDSDKPMDGQAAKLETNHATVQLESNQVSAKTPVETQTQGNVSAEAQSQGVKDRVEAYESMIRSMK